MVTVSEAEVLPPDVEAKTPPAELDVRVTVSALVVGLPKASCS